MEADSLSEQMMEHLLSAAEATCFSPSDLTERGSLLQKAMDAFPRVSDLKALVALEVMLEKVPKMVGAEVSPCEYIRALRSLSQLAPGQLSGPFHFR
jgi:hypothetical protein